tara:strand:- start:3570 stop:4829 length:1260 start_codon:yes stop_codon:yes gene_type:complete
VKWNGEKFEEALNDDLDNLLSQEDRKKLRDNIDSDANYKKSASWYYLLQELLREISKQDEKQVVPAGFTESVMQRISNIPVQSQPSNQYKFYKSFSFGLGMAACIVGLAFILWQPSDKVGQSLERVRPGTVVIADSSSSSSGSHIIPETSRLKILSAIGQVQVFKENGFVWQSIDRGVSINVRDKVRTLAGASIHMAYEDGVELKLKSNSLIELENDGLRVFHGDSWVHVKRKGRIFQTHTPNLVASVRGTIYDVSVRYSQQSYSEFIGGVTNKNVLKGTDPALYFRDVSLDTLNEMGNRHFASAVESNVRVYESSVDVKPIDPSTGNLGNGLLLEEGQQVKLISLASSLKESQIRNLEREDFHYWEMAIPEFLTPEQNSLDSSKGSIVTEPRDENAKEGSQPVSEDVSPVEAMNQLHR